MKRFACLLLLALFVLTAAQPVRAGGTPAELELTGRIRARLDAAGRGNAAEWASFVADDCLCGLESKAGVQRAIANRPPSVKNWYGDILDLTLRFLGDAAVARYRITEYSDVGGKLTSVQLWRTETYARKAGLWLLVAGADTLIPPEPTPIQVDPRVFEGYVGRYQYTPGSIDTVTREGDRLFVQPSGEPRVELFPETDSTYFAKGQPWRLVFVRGPGGAVTSLVFRQDGQEWTAIRLP
ncbi:MAG TPA: DUF3471 domain-containing protein [Thermoanaerobaculia bacterium]|nr:DUF3471 domain-containing protein [Thermoanaerobaculia bacterium]